MRSFLAKIEYDENTDEYILPLGEEVCDGLGWKVGDSLDWKDNGDGTYTITKVKQEMEWVLVEAISQYRMRYMVQVPKGKSEWALDTVTMAEAKEFSQKWLGEVISSHRVVSEEDAIKLCDEDNDYCGKWPDEKKKEAFFTKDGEKADK